MAEQEKIAMEVAVEFPGIVDVMVGLLVGVELEGMSLKEHTSSCETCMSLNIITQL